MTPMCHCSLRVMTYLPSELRGLLPPMISRQPSRPALKSNRLPVQWAYLWSRCWKGSDEGMKLTHWIATCSPLIVRLTSKNNSHWRVQGVTHSNYGKVVERWLSYIIMGRGFWQYELQLWPWTLLLSSCSGVPPSVFRSLIRAALTMSRLSLNPGNDRFFWTLSRSVFWMLLCSWTLRP